MIRKHPAALSAAAMPPFRFSRPLRLLLAGTAAACALCLSLLSQPRAGASTLNPTCVARCDNNSTSCTQGCNRAVSCIRGCRNIFDACLGTCVVP